MGAVASCCTDRDDVEQARRGDKELIQAGFGLAREDAKAFLERGTLTVEFPDGGRLQLAAGSMLEIAEATYGAGQTWVDVKERVLGMLASADPGTVGSSALGTDPLPDESKVLRVRYRPPVDPVTKELAEGEVLQPRELCIEGVVEAKYGVGQHWADVLEHVEGPVFEGRALPVRNDLLGGDPLSGEAKTLRLVFYQHQRAAFLLDSGLAQPATFEVIAPTLFSSIRKAIGSDFSDAHFASLASGTLKGGEKQVSGKSGEIFWFSHDNAFVLKTIGDEELSTLVGMLPQLASYLGDHPDSLLTRYVGAYRLSLRGEVIQFVVMNNVFQGAKIDVMYDLKGTTEDRWVEPAPGKCLKDNNFAQMSLFCEDGAALALHRAVSSDATFLMRRRIMDYSMMLGVSYVKPGTEVEQAGGHRYSKLMGGIPGEERLGMLSAPKSCVFYVGIIDMLVTYSWKKVVANSLKSATVGLMNEIDTVPPRPYKLRFEAYFRQKVMGYAENITVTDASASLFKTPFPPMGRSGGTAAFFQVRFTDEGATKCPEAKESVQYWIGKDLARAQDEVLFYEAAKKLEGAGPEWDLLQYMTPYKGICRAPCEVREGKPPEELDVMLLRNMRDGCSTCRMLDIKVGSVTAVAGWQGKSAVAAYQQSVVDSMTNSALQGFRLEGFDSPPATLESLEQMITTVNILGVGPSAEKQKKLKRMNLQRMCATQFLRLFLDLHETGGKPGAPARALAEPSKLSRVEYQELVLLNCIEQLSAFVAATRRAPAPQQWVGSSIMFCFDSGSLPARESLEQEAGRKGLGRFQIFDWGRSELNTPQNHERLPPNKREERVTYWRLYREGAAKLLYDCCRLYVGRFWLPKRSVALSLWDLDLTSADDFIGILVPPLEELAEQPQTLVDRDGSPCTCGGLLEGAKPTELRLSMAPLALPEPSRLESGWSVRVHSASNVPMMDLLSESDCVVDVAGLPEDAGAAQEALKSMHSHEGLRDTAHTTSLIMDCSAPVWEEEFELATLREEARAPLLQALSLALAGREEKPVTAEEVQALFPQDLASAVATSRQEMQDKFVSLCYPDDSATAQELLAALEGFPRQDILRLAHFGQWLLGQPGQEDCLVFSLFFVAAARKPLGPRDLIRLGQGFLAVLAKSSGAEEQGKAVKLGKILTDMELGDLDTSNVAEAQGIMLELAARRLQKPWTAYCDDGQEEQFRTPAASALPGLRRSRTRGLTAKAKLQNSMLFVQAFKTRHNTRGKPVGTREFKDLAEAEDAEDGEAEKAEDPGSEQQLFSEASDPSGRLVAALPVIMQALVGSHGALRRQADAVREALGTDLGCGPLGDPYGSVERRACSVPAGGCCYAPSPGTAALAFESIAGPLFDHLRRSVAGIPDEDVLQALGDPGRRVQVLSTNSKSGEIFLRSTNGRFIIKTVGKHEAEALVELLPRYAQHFHSCPDSLLGRYLYLFSLDLSGAGFGSRYITIMHSVFDSPLPISLMYDLKGSTKNRSAAEGETVKKDNDWINQGMRLKLSAKDATRVREAHARDTEFLCSCNVMDYSMLVGVAKAEGGAAADGDGLASEDGSERYFVGIIDFLVQFGMKKFGEHLLHVAGGQGQSASVTSPSAYAERQRNFMQGRMLPEAQAAG